VRYYNSLPDAGNDKDNRLHRSIEIVLCNVFTPTRKKLDLKHASQKREKHKYTKEDEDIYALR